MTDEKTGQNATPVQEVGPSFQPLQGAFFRTLSYPQFDEAGNVNGRIWMEAGRKEKSQNWVLWRKSVRMQDDALTGEIVPVISADILFENTNFVDAYGHMTTFEKAKQSQNIEPLTTHTPAKLGGDYFRQFAWREGLMNSRSGRLYPFSEEMIHAANFFDERDMDMATAFLKRQKEEQFTAVPVTLPAVDWKRAYNKDRERIDQRLRALYFQHDDDKESFDLAKQIIAHEKPEILYAHMQQGFSPRIFEHDPERHFALLAAAVDRTDVETLSLLSDAGVSFHVRHKDETPLERVLLNRHYSHLHIMLSRDGAELANYTDESGNSAAVMTMQLKDRQAFRMLYQEGLDYGHVDQNGWKLIHHAFDNGFIPGLYAWIDEGLPIDAPVGDTDFTGLSIARRNGDQKTIDFAVSKGANPVAPVFPEEGAKTPGTEKTAEEVSSGLPFSLSLLYDGNIPNTVIEQAARAQVATGQSLAVVDGGNASVFELCWQNRSPNADFNRAALIPVFAELGADPSARLPDGSTTLTRVTGRPDIDLDFLKAVAPFATDPNTPDADDNNFLHVLQLNPSETAGNSQNVAAILGVFPTFDINRRNGDGYSNVALAVRLDRARTLQKLPQSVAASIDWAQETQSDWSILDIAFTSACAAAPVNGTRRDRTIDSISDRTRSVVLDLISKAPPGSIAQAISRKRPDNKTLLQTMRDEGTSAGFIEKLARYEKPGL